MKRFELPATKRFILFTGADYYPGGGMKDFVGFFESAELADAEALRQVKEGWLTKGYCWWHVFDLLECKVVSSTERFFEEGLSVPETAKIWSNDDY